MWKKQRPRKQSLFLYLEYCNFMGEEKDKNKNAEEIPNGETTQELMKLAKQHEMYIHVGMYIREKR